MDKPKVICIHLDAEGKRCETEALDGKLYCSVHLPKPTGGGGGGGSEKYVDYDRIRSNE
jgi:hypothetical protein